MPKMQINFKKTHKKNYGLSCLITVEPIHVNIFN
jgi:hypothetical protein